MNQTSWVIQVLDDSLGRSIEYQNRLWLRQNVEELDIRVSVEDCVIDTFGIAAEWENDGAILVQDGKPVQFKADFHPGKEALQLVPRESENGYLVFLYSPKE